MIDPHGTDRRRVSMLTINADDGQATINNFRGCDLERNNSDYAIETDAPFVWEIARVKGPTGELDGFAISGTYSHCSTYTFSYYDR